MQIIGVGIIIFHRIISSPEMGSRKRVRASPAGLLWRDSHSRPSDQPPLLIPVQKVMVISFFPPMLIACLKEIWAK